MTIQGAIAELQALINADDVPFYYKGGIKKVIETIQMDLPIEPKRPRGTETMMVDGEPMEIDPLSYEVGYTHGQSERPKGEWIVYSLVDEGRVELECPECGDTFVRAVDYRPHFCENCGADMRGDTE